MRRQVNPGGAESVYTGETAYGRRKRSTKEWLTNMTKTIFSVLAIVALSAVLLFGDTTPPAPPSAADMIANQVARLTKLLTLTTAQQASATTIFTTEQTALDALRTPMDTAHTALDTAVKSNDAKGIANGALAIGSLTAQQVSVQATADAAFYAILTADQKTVYDELKAAGLGGPPPRQPGPGGPGGPGPRH